ncbi:MAG: EAL domain-containing protein [Burkholderiales bacterium]|nr:EAL domain-containing protein [Burkholderiales bacterium]
MASFINSLSLKTRIIGTVAFLMTVAIAGFAVHLVNAAAYRPVAGFSWHILAMVIVIVGAVSALLCVLLEKLLAPLNAARRAMQRMSEGKKPLSSLQVVRNDEIGKMIHHFNKLIAERNATEEKLEYLSHHDVLTGFPNRLLVQSRFPHALAYAESQGLRVALLYLDLDNFKSINDSLGHAAGDEVIKMVALRLRECVNSTHMVSRLGGDEFLIVLRNVADTAEIENIMNGILEELTQTLLYEGREISTSVSIGAAVYPEDGRDFDSLCKKANTAVVQAKESGRNTYRFFDMNMNVDAVERLMLRGHMKRALERNEFVLHYQPQVDLDTGAVIGAEALVRWQHPEFGLLPPGLFISIAEDSGLIVPIGEWVLREACAQAAEWQKNGLPALVMAVNLSAAQFRRGNLERTLIDALTESGLSPEYLELELTESILIKDTDNVLQQVKRLKSLGIKLSIDDFGTGYSSLAYLKKFAVDKIKIDQSFVRDLANNADDGAIVKAIIQMARSLNLRTIAEGVEHERTLEHLRLHQCNEAQGYHFSKPMPKAKFAMFLEAAAAAGHARPSAAA